PNIQKDDSQNGAKQDELAPTTSTTSMTALHSSAVQSMLRNTTELGDCGPLAYSQFALHAYLVLVPAYCHPNAVLVPLTPHSTLNSITNDPPDDDLTATRRHG
ncbi:hypothetical protein CLAIMM_14778, partial [Cladophialophora immunda]